MTRHVRSTGRGDVEWARGQIVTAIHTLSQGGLLDARVDCNLTLRMICRTEHSHSSKSPLRLIFDFLDADGSASLSIDEFVAGASSALGRPIPRALLAPYFDPRHFTDDRHLGVVSFDVFEAICVENFA